MACLTDATISGFNEYRHDRRRETSDALMSLTLFNTELEQRYIARGTEIPEITTATYVADGGSNWGALCPAPKQDKRPDGLRRMW